MALKVIGYQSYTLGLQKILRRAEGMAERFEELRIQCPGLNEVIDCFILAGRLANHVSPKTDSYGKRTQSINASEDVAAARTAFTNGASHEEAFKTLLDTLNDIFGDIHSLTWQSEIYYTDSAARHQDAYSLFGLMARYQASEKLSFMLNAENLSDKTYLVNAWNHSYGAPRNFMITTKYIF